MNAKLERFTAGIAVIASGYAVIGWVVYIAIGGLS